MNKSLNLIPLLVDYSRIKHPVSGIFFDIHTKKGKKLLQNYINHIGGRWTSGECSTENIKEKKESNYDKIKNFMFLNIDTPKINKRIEELKSLEKLENEWTDKINTMLRNYILIADENLLDFDITYYRIIRNNENMLRGDKNEPKPLEGFIKSKMTITKIELNNYFRIYVKPKILSCGSLDLRAIGSITLKEKLEKISNEKNNRYLINDLYMNSEMFPNKNEEYEITGVFLLNLLKKGIHAHIKSNFGEIINDILKDLVLINHNQKFNNFISNGNQVFFTLLLDEEQRNKYIYNHDEPPGFEILGNRKNESVNCGNKDKIHIVYKKEEEAYSIYKFIEYVESDDHGLSEGDEKTNAAGKFELSISALKWIDLLEIDNTLKYSVKWNDYLDIMLSGRANIVLYNLNDSYHTQKAVNHLLDYWNKEGIDEKIGSFSNNLFYNIRISKSLFIGSDDTKTKEEMRDKYNYMKDPIKKDLAKDLLKIYYTIDPLLENEKKYFCSNLERISKKDILCLIKKYNINIDDLCGLNEYSENLYPKSLMSKYIKRDCDYYGYLINDDNIYSKTCYEDNNI